MRLNEGDRAYQDLDYKGPVHRYRLFVHHPDDEHSLEELDVDAKNRGHARRIAAAALARDYVQGMRVKVVEGPMVGLYL